MGDIIRDFYHDLKRQEDTYGIKIVLPKENIIDSRHLDCFWYGGDIGHIEYKDYKIVIGAYGDRILAGSINGRDFYYKNKRNTYAYGDSDNNRITDDSHLHRLLDSTDPHNSLVFYNSNWFEVDLIDPSGKFIDLFCYCDNVLDDNLLDCFSDVSTYFEYVDQQIEEEE